MFDCLVESKRRDKSYRRLLFAPLAVCMQLSVVGVFAVRSYLTIPPLPPPSLEVSFSQVAATPPPPPPPPPAAPAPEPEPAPAPEPEPEPPLEPSEELIEPETVPEQLPVEPLPEPEPASSAGVPGGVLGGVAGGTPWRVPVGPLPEAPPEAEPPPDPDVPLILTDEIEPPVRTRVVEPRYPELARQAHREGMVILRAVIGRDGTVGDIEVLRGLEPGCTDAAIEALKKWRYRPARLRGEPVTVYMTVVIEFKMY